MNRTPLVLLPAALAVGFLANLLAQSPVDPALGFTLFFLLLALAVGGVARASGVRIYREGWGWIATGVVLALFLALRSSEPLHLLAVLGAAAAFTFPALRAGAPWMGRAGATGPVEAVAASTGYALFGGLLAPRGSGGGLLRGALLALPLLLVFGALFAAADPAFEAFLSRLVGSALEGWGGHLALTLLMAWFAGGYLLGLGRDTRLREGLEARLPRPTLGILEVGTVMGLVALLFLAFVGVQFRFLFGGAEAVAATPGLTHAAYAREGFQQLLLASLLVLPLLLLADWLLARRGPGDERLFRTLGWVQLALLGVVLASALHRILVYRDAYGLTEARLFGMVALAWVGVTAGWLGLSVLRGRRDRFIPVALPAGYLLLLALGLANPDARIAQWNLERVDRGPSALAANATPPSTAIDAAGPSDSVPGPGPVTRLPLDAHYLASLGAGAVPVILDRIEGLAPGDRCILAESLLRRWGAEGGTPGDWRSWNLAESRARDRVRRHDDALRSHLRPGGACPGPGSRPDPGHRGP